MVQNDPPSDLFDPFKNEGLSDLDMLLEDLGHSDLPAKTDEERFFDVPQGPSLPIILLSAASAIAGFIVALYVSYRELSFSIEASAAIATFAASTILGITGATLSAITQTRAATSNIAFSCGLIVLSLLFFGLCLLVGAVAALLLLMLAGG
ncbi:MAG: hypothetical protein R2932_25490 [Caldilineaceae bacterium]